LAAEWELDRRRHSPRSAAEWDMASSALRWSVRVGPRLVPTLLVALACSRPHQSSDQREPARTFEDQLQVVVPAEVGLRPDALASMVTAAAEDSHRDLASVLVARNGCLVVEAYFNGDNRESIRDVRSVAKSLTGTLIGIALRDKAIASLNTSVTSFFTSYLDPESTAKRAEITIRHLLEMRSGLDADDWYDNPESPGTESRMESADNRTMFALHVPVAAAPGERWQYSSINTLLLGRIVSLATGMDLEAYAREKLFEPLGFGRYEWRRDSRGQVVPQGNLLVRARDLLKVGLLFENRGLWHERQLVPQSWILEATTSHSQLPTDSTTGLGELYQGYGYQWWTSERPAPSGTVKFYFASGNGGQRLFVVPSFRLVVVVTSSAYNKRYAHYRAHDILRAVLDAVDEDAVQLGRCT
jgi:CubicO group peptidase (beta-lactamase class C family)